jgi:hypothetical protein
MPAGGLSQGVNGALIHDLRVCGHVKEHILAVQCQLIEERPSKSVALAREGDVQIAPARRTYGARRNGG